MNKKLTAVLVVILLVCLPMNVMASELLDCIKAANQALYDCAYKTIIAGIGSGLAGAALGALRLNLASVGIGACAGVITGIASHWPECETEYIKDTDECYAKYPLPS